MGLEKWDGMKMVKIKSKKSEKLVLTLKINDEKKEDIEAKNNFLMLKEHYGVTLNSEALRLILKSDARNHGIINSVPN